MRDVIPKQDGSGLILYEGIIVLTNKLFSAKIVQVYVYGLGSGLVIKYCKLVLASLF